jgi:hypothetical protein
LVPVGRGKEVEKGHGQVNRVQILCAHVCKWKNDTCWNYSRNGGGIKENGKGGEFKYDIDTLSEHLQMPQCTPTQHNNKTKYVTLKNSFEGYRVAHVVQCLLCRHEVLSSNPSTTKV